LSELSILLSVEGGVIIRRKVMTKSKLKILILLSVLLYISCGGSKLSYVGGPSKISVPIDTIALDPSGGILADAIGVELLNYGFNVVDTQKTTGLMARLNLDEISIMQPTNLTKLKESGIDAFLSVKAAAGYDGLPQSASVRLNSTQDGKIITGVSWQNGWGGAPGSPADRTMRKGITEAAAEIAIALSSKVRSIK
jgi:hypothetical protein